MRRAVLALLGGYLLIAAGNRVAEHFGAMRCGCADDCWCRQPRLSLFRWVFPWGHLSAHDVEEKVELDPMWG